jgi:hypothetical protein
MLTSVLLLMQFVVSAKAGFVNYVDGTATVRRQQQVQVGAPIQTQSGSHVELLLSPGSFLRIGENSQVVFDSVDLSNIEVRVVSGSALIESATINKDFPIHVTSGGVKVSIVAAGMYRFSADSAFVLNGKLHDDYSGAMVKKGQQVAGLAGSNHVEKFEPAVSDDLDAWSEQRDGDLSKANVLAYRDRSASYYNSFANYATFGVYPLDAAWLYSGFLGGYTFLPFQGYRSFYGYSYVPLTGFGFTPFIPAANRPFGNATANTFANQGPRPTAVGAGVIATANGGGFGANNHAPIRAGGGNSGMMNPGAAMHSSADMGGGMMSSAPSSGGGAMARPSPAPAPSRAPAPAPAAAGGGRRP